MNLEPEILEALTVLHAELSKRPVEQTREYLEPITEVLMTGRSTTRRYECVWGFTTLKRLFPGEDEWVAHALYRAEEIVMDFRNSPLCVDVEGQWSNAVKLFLNIYRNYKAQQKPQ